MTEPFLACHSGIWWPVSDIHARAVLERDVRTAIPALLGHVTGREFIVQAGGNVGLFPLALAEHFSAVLTAEPDPTNYACLKRNVGALDSEGRITALHAAFGEDAGACNPVVVEQANCGAHRVDFTSGTVPVWTIDELVLDELGAKHCDCIWLDCEGSELFALRGAVNVIDKFSPVLCIEDKGLDNRFFNTPAGALQDFLSEFGYIQIDQIARDKVFKRTAE